MGRWSRFEVDRDAVLARGPRRIPTRAAEPGLLVELASGNFIGTVVHCDTRQVELEDRRGRRRRFTLSPGAFLVDDVAVSLVAPAEPEPAVDATTAGADDLGRTASGSVPAADRSPRTARASRLWVEGIHDAELLETVWGDDLRAAGVVVEPLHGADDLAGAVASFRPGPERRLGILLDHLVPGSKESRLAAQVDDPHVLITGHPFVDVWAAIDPAVVGRRSWPDVPRGEPYKDGLAHRLGFADRHEAWRVLSSRVHSWDELDRSLIRAVEELIDHVTLDG